MTNQRHECPKCRAAMEEGFLLDRTHGVNYGQGTWIAGLPQRSFWVGLIIRKRPQISVVTYRCSRCGFLESYASGQ